MLYRKIQLYLVFIFLFIFANPSFAQGVWTQKANYGAGAVERAVGFSIGTKGYIICGMPNCSFQQVWEWDQATNVWTQKASYPGQGTAYGSGFSIGTKGYYGTGIDGCIHGGYPDFYEFD